MWVRTTSPAIPANRSIASGELFAAAKPDRDDLSLLLTRPDDREVRDLLLLREPDASAEGQVALVCFGAQSVVRESVPDGGRVARVSPKPSRTIHYARQKRNVGEASH